MKYIYNHNSEGFTLLEIIIVIAIAGILAAIAVPGFVNQLPKYRLSGATRQVMGDLMWARMQAVSEKNEFRIFILDSHRYQILDDDDNDGSVGSGEKVQTKDIRDDYPDVSISNTTNPIFFPRGSASMGTITLSNSSGSRKLKIHLTGRVKMG